MRVFYRNLILTLSTIISLTCCLLPSSFAADIGTGIVAVEDGDDRMRPAAVVHVGTAAGFVGRGYVYGRDYGPVSERNYIVSLNKRFDISNKTWQGLLGAAVLNDNTEIKYKDYPDENTSYSSTNVGMAFGLHWSLIDSKAMQLKATWDSHVFPAGSGFILLANARKSTIGLTAAIGF